MHCTYHENLSYGHSRASHYSKIILNVWKASQVFTRRLESAVGTLGNLNDTRIIHQLHPSEAAGTTVPTLDYGLLHWMDNIMGHGKRSPTIFCFVA
ncbi:hypothetical protein Moror_10759 [Moniliophthora roreri MCA 2997]|uniref:Uncharacterized protein n=1 Tax=Moniliophthora roreri (strain MCA 2997) TaxID=1381753 RepID=V2X6G2_MONRO|nr:hypothetical protein Moror_10759 [Moniliophthora roreri MCA 2997]